MNTTEVTLMIILILFILGGLYLIYRDNKGRANYPDSSNITYDKDGIPIIPRHERNLIDDVDMDDTLAGETVITPDRERLEPIIEEIQIHNYDNDDVDGNNGRDDEVAELEHNDAYLAEDHGNDEEYAAVAEKIEAVHAEKDLFSSLASATENLMPAIDTAEEPEFTENSPVLDQHLLAEASQDQNSPLNHAEENINISLIPKSNFTSIHGSKVLALVEQYGLKYGAMNMFHRYENKDGTGILWFSMMGMTHNGIAPFDLNTLTSTEFSGLVLFLSLPHPKALQGFDSMMSIAGLIARELDTLILDEHNEQLTREYKQLLRNRVQEY